MALFPEKEHQLYNFTFLLNTFAVLHFDERNEQNFNQEAKNRMKDFLIDNFNTSGQHNYPAEGVQLENNDKSIRYEFASNYTSLRIGRPQYTTFGKSMLPNAVPLRWFVSKVLLLEKVKQIDVRKISVFPMQIGGKEPTKEQASEMIGNILTKDVLSLVTVREINDVNCSIGPVTFHVMEDPENHFIYEILLGLLKDPKRTSIYNVILDANCVYKPSDGIMLTEIEDKQEEMSKSLYDLFHWAVQKHVIDVMKGGVGNE
jgi:uncharacterized protein (TIGR04255 family)